MVGYDPSRIALSKTEHAIAGGFSGAVTRFLCQPLDVVKIRFQLQVEPLSKKTNKSKYWSISQACKKILEEEGLAALWKGHVPAQLLSITYGIVQFVSYEMFTKQMWHLYGENRHQPTVNFVSGAAAGSLATLVSFPYDVIRTRLVAQGEPKIYYNISDAFRQIYTNEGARAFFKGLTPTLLQVSPHTGVQFASYSLFKQTLETWGWPNPLHSLICGCLAGLCAKSAVYPLDLARKRLQVQGFESARKPFGKVFKCSGLLECLWLTLREERIGGLFKGLGPSLLKAAVTTALHFSVYEQTCSVLASLHQQR